MKNEKISETIKESIAPCGLCCETCFAHVDGDIRKQSIKLKEKLGNFHIQTKRFEALLGNPVFKKYTDFKEMLDYFASENCRGCRNEQCKLFKNCGVRKCHQEKQLDFCFQCESFPCENTHFNPDLYNGWMVINEIIRKKGITTYYKKTREKPRYP